MNTCMTCDQPFAPYRAQQNHCVPCEWYAELTEAKRRLELGEPFATTAAELGLTPAELTEAFDSMDMENDQ